MSVRIEHPVPFGEEFARLDPQGSRVITVQGHELWAWYDVPIRAPKTDVVVYALSSAETTVGVEFFAHDCAMLFPGRLMELARMWEPDLRSGVLLRFENIGPSAEVSLTPTWLNRGTPQSAMGNYAILAEPDPSGVHDLILRMNLGHVRPATFDGLVLGVSCREPDPAGEYEAVDSHPPERRTTFGRFRRKKSP